MSNGRTYFGAADIKKINKLMGIKAGKPKTPKSYDEQKRSSQRIKFCKCRECGGMMTYTGTNCLICDNIVEKTITRTLKDGTKKEVKVNEPCGNVNIVSDEYIGYLEYLFDGVPNNQAVLDRQAKTNKEEK